jgi:amino acid transporter
VFYAPAEAYRFIGSSAIFFIAFTSLFIHYMTTRLVEIAEILEHHGIFGGGVYSFSYLVLGPVVSFVAVSSIMVDYILTACLSAVSAIQNVLSFFPALTDVGRMRLIISAAIGIIWGVAGLNIIGIKENARFTFLIFIFAAVVFLNLIVSGVLSLDADSFVRLKEGVAHASSAVRAGPWYHEYGMFIASVASCVLAYSGVESVLQTAGLVKSWKEIGRAYIFLACTVGIVTPVVAALALSAPIDFHNHEGDLITFYATMLNGAAFGILVAALASFTLIMAVNTAFVASSELAERVAHRYGFLWLVQTNKRHSLYRIHIANAVFYSGIVLLTAGSQAILADMYAIGLVASFCINMGSLLIYRYFMGTKEVIHFNTSRVITLIMFVIFVSCFGFLAYHKPHGTELWAAVTALTLVAGLLIARKRAPEIKEIAETDSEMDLVLYFAESGAEDVHLHFRRPREQSVEDMDHHEAYVTFYNPRQGAPSKAAPNHFRLASVRRTTYQHIIAVLKVVEYELADRRVCVHFGWPLSSWIDRIAIGVMVFNIMRLPKQFPNFEFTIHYPGKPYTGAS